MSGTRIRPATAIAPRILAALAALAALATAGCLSSITGQTSTVAGTAGSGEKGGAPSLGAFEVSMSGLARGEIRPSSCHAGDLSQYLGADLTDEAKRLTVRLVVDPLYGPALRVYDEDEPFDRSVLFFREDCGRFEMSFAPTGWIVNDVVVRELSLDVDCENEDGATISGHASAKCS